MTRGTLFAGGASAVLLRLGARGMLLRLGASAVLRRLGARGMLRRLGARGMLRRLGASAVLLRLGASGMLLRLGASAVLVGLAACAGQASTAASGGDAGVCDLAGFLAVQHAHVNHAEVTLCGTVARVREPRRTRSGVHRVFYVDVGGGDRIAIDANLDEMGDFPIHVGETTTIRGEYYYDDDGREGVHWTHHTDRGSHPPGFVILNGTRYE